MSSIGPNRYDAFLSYNTLDHEAVNELAERLRGERLVVFLDRSELTPGQEYQLRLAEGLRDSRTCVVFLGPNGLGRWQKQELQVAIDRRAGNEAFRVIPVLLPGAERPRRGDVAHLEFLINAPWVEFPKTLGDERAFRELKWGITGERPEIESSDECCPYRGLESFGPADARFFFGRKNLTGWMVSALRREVSSPEGVRFLGVLGPSGSGKSSVVLAGLVPSLGQGGIEGSEQWKTSILRPGDDLLKNLAAEIARHSLPDNSLSTVERIRRLAKDLRRGTRALEVFARSTFNGQPDGVRLLVVIDQFEEIFTYRPPEGKDRRRFDKRLKRVIANLLNAAAAPDGRVVVILTMRSDFVSTCAQVPQLSAALSARQVLVGPMTVEELTEAIERPAYLVGCEVESGLTQRLLADIKGQSGALPLLQFALKEVWTNRKHRRLTLEEYLVLGGDEDRGEDGGQKGIERVFNRRANAVYAELTPQQRDECRRLFLCLIQPATTGAEYTKRRVPLRELIPADPDRADAVKGLLSSLAHRDARLITTDGAWAEEATVEIAHEALIRRWKLLRDWSTEARDFLLWRQRLGQRISEYERSGRDPALLLSADQLGEADRLERSLLDDLGEVERGFLKRSRWRTILLRFAEYERSGRRPALLLSADQLGEADRLERSLLDDLGEVERGFLKRSRRRFLHRRLMIGAFLVILLGAYLGYSVYQSSVVLFGDILRADPKDLPRLVWQWTRYRIWGDPWLKKVRDRSDPSSREHFNASISLLPSQYAQVEPLLKQLPSMGLDRARTFLDVLTGRPGVGDSALAILRAQLNSSSPIEDDEDANDRRDQHRAKAAISLFRLGSPKELWALLQHSTDPTVRSYIVNWVQPLGVDSRAIRSRLDELEAAAPPARSQGGSAETDRDRLFHPVNSVRRALILALGNYGDSLPPEERDLVTNQLRQTYRDDPDAGIHAAAEWTLRRCNSLPDINAAEAILRGFENREGRHWFVDKSGQSFVVLRPPGETLIGSPATEVGRDPDETLHRRAIEGAFAMATSEVTVAQYNRFRAAYPDVEPPQKRHSKYSEDPNGPVNGITWYQAARYCNWLSRQEGLDEYYQPNDQGHYDEGTTFPSGRSKNLGYRLPTEAEWEYACRAGTGTIRYYGRSEKLLPAYARILGPTYSSSPDSQFMPNDFGLFDILGNVCEWCQDVYLDNSSKKETGLPRYLEDSPVRSRVDRVLRGGSFIDLPVNVRAAERVTHLPSGTDLHFGFRVVRSVSEP